MKQKIQYILFIILSLILIACSLDQEGQYNESIQLGLDYIAAEDYSRALVQFEQALDEAPDDIRAKALLNQTIHYEKSIKENVAGNNEKALEEAEKVITFIEGSDGLIAKAESLINELQTEEEEGAVETESVNSEAQESSKQEYTYDSFKGIYVLYEGDPFNSEISMAIILTESYYIEIIPSWNAYIEYYNIGKSIDGDNLYINYEPRYNEMEDVEDGNLVAKIEFDDHEKTLLIDGLRYYEPTQIESEEIKSGMSDDILNEL